MPYRPPVSDSSSEREAADGGYFGPLAWARYVLLTTFEPDGTHVSTPVQAVLDGHRAYFRAWSRSGIAKRLRRTAAAQVSPCTVLGLCSFGAPFGAAVRLLPGEQASGVAAKLADKYPVQQRFLIPLLHQMWRGQMVHYELLAPGPPARTPASHAPGPTRWQPRE